jgi:hypothetical protein
MQSGWIGVDLDATLAVYSGMNDITDIGSPVPLMVDRVKGWLERGREVRIMTARVSSVVGRNDADRARRAIEAWCLEALGRVLPITSEKDFHMIELWDDRAVQVFPNTGFPVMGSHSRIDDPDFINHS